MSKCFTACLWNVSHQVRLYSLMAGTTHIQMGSFKFALWLNWQCTKTNKQTMKSIRLKTKCFLPQLLFAFFAIQITLVGCFSDRWKDGWMCQDTADFRTNKSNYSVCFQKCFFLVLQFLKCTEKSLHSIE